MKKEKEKRRQFIVCYDIENSQIYDIYYYYENKDKYIKCPKFQEYFSKYIGNPEIYIPYEMIDRSQKLMQWYNDYNKTNDVLVASTHKYIANLYIYDCQTSEIRSVFTYQPYTDDIAFDDIIDLWLTDCDIMFTAHNLDYEYSYIRYNTKLLHRLHTECKEYNIIAVNTTNIKSIEFISESGSKFIIRDTYLMTNKSISALGNAYNLPKLEYDYIKTRLFKSDLTPLDYTYNQRDNEIAMQAIFELQSQLSVYDDITKLPISATHHAKNVCKYNPEVNYKKGKWDLYSLHQYKSPKYNLPDLYLYQKFFNASGGGLIGVNPLFTGIFLHDVHSFDIKSAHPSQFYNKRFPDGSSIKQITDPGDVDYIKRRLLKLSQMLQDNPQKFYNSFNPEYDYLLKVEFANLRAKRLPNDNIILSLGSGKQAQSESDNEITNRQAWNVKAKTVNGKTVKSKSYTKWFYGIDLLYHISFYDFDELVIHEAYKYIMIPCDEYIISKSNYYGEYKERYKSFKKYMKKHTFEETLQYCIEHGAEEYTLKNITADNYKMFLETELLRIKGIFNGLFGQEYQNIYHHKMDFAENFEILDAEKFELMEKLNEDYKEKVRKCSTHYTTGAYTAAWSRFELSCMIWHSIKNNATVYYFHTDSVKIGGCSPQLFDNWIQDQKNTWFKYNVFKFGAVDYEETFKLFYVPETLKNVGIENINGLIEIDITFSGLKAEIYFKDILDKYQGTDYYTNIIPLYKELKEKLKPQLIAPELTGKLVRNRTFAGIITDLGQVNFGCLEPVGYKFLIKE